MLCIKSKLQYVYKKPLNKGHLYIIAKTVFPERVLI